MELEGIVENCQHTTRVTGGGESSTTTRFITLFRIDGHPVRLVSGKAVNLADGDKVVVSGRMKSGELYARALHNISTNSESHSGIWNRVIKAIVLPVFGIFFIAILSFFPLIGSIAWYLYPAFLLWAGYLLWTAVATYVSLTRVRPTM
ncbi:MAG: hypothetical protein P1V20_18170 [Verrucomicrobiales bacterium]|nr:hypothetical protein [Verrucomicrobiales bacterium]